ncbi:hypothetical protein EJ03DRAFT_185867 [Teratosphaeria nubilosa]|uniref:DUF7702 domain-containing protein n=1 Tax=Teratosphaeria nubilosa TaxID=161662 RepID=A0A6G1LIT4_9PEZI|nr:hypothetical protein EJ03DRAFT_185867 [Teratosphaeria nubilosa]
MLAIEMPHRDPVGSTVTSVNQATTIPTSNIPHNRHAHLQRRPIGSNTRLLRPSLARESPRRLAPRLQQTIRLALILILSIFSIVGASCTLCIDTKNDHLASLPETAAITSALGTPPLLLALLGLLERINTGLEQGTFLARTFSLIHIVPIAASAVAMYEFWDGAGAIETGKQLLEVTFILFLAIYISLAGVVLYVPKCSRWVLAAEQKLLYAGVISMPFMLVRITCTVTVAFPSAGGVIYFRDVKAWAQGFMQTLMETIVVFVFVTAGLLTPGPRKQEPVDGRRNHVENGYASESQCWSPVRQHLPAKWDRRIQAWQAYAE